MVVRLNEKVGEQELARVRVKAIAIRQALAEFYGPLSLHPHRDPLSTLVLTVLTQHTSDVNAERAFENLVRVFPTWEAVRDAPIPEIAEAIKQAGLSNVKAPRIKEMLQKIGDLTGATNLDFMYDLDREDAREWLQSLKGVGPKTAACVLIFSLEKPAMPVDTHLFRLCRRIGLISSQSTPAQAQEFLESILPLEEQKPFHVYMITHGRRICRAQNPSCASCPINHLCDNPVCLPKNT